MKQFGRIFVALVSVLLSMSLSAHEGHAQVGTLIHSAEHAVWWLLVLLPVSVLPLVIFVTVIHLAARYLPRQAS